MGPMTLWKHQNRSGDLLGPNCLRGPLFSFAVKPLYTDTRCVTALHSYTALYSAIHYTAIQLYIAIHYTASTTSLCLRGDTSPDSGKPADEFFSSCHPPPPPLTTEPRHQTGAQMRGGDRAALGELVSCAAAAPTFPRPRGRGPSDCTWDVQLGS